MADFVEVTVDSIRVSLVSQQRIVILREVNSNRFLPIWIGIFEAESITIALQNVEVARPLTHDLLKNALERLGARTVRVEVVALRDEVYYGNVVVEMNGREINIDSRPSDAIALAVRAHVPIFVAREVMDAAGIVPDEDVQPAVSPPAPSSEATVPVDEERLSIFEDFLEQLDLDSPGQEDDDEEEDN